MPPAKNTRPWRPYYSRSRGGCQFCRERRKKCNEARPSCSSCLRAHHKCVWPTDKRQAPSGDVCTSKTTTNCQTTHDIPLDSSETLAPMMLFDSLAPSASLTDSECDTATANLVLEYYIRITSSQLVASTQLDNPFISCIMPLARQSNLLLSAVLCLGGTHLCATSKNRGALNTPRAPKPEVDIRIRRATWHYYGIVISGLRSALVKGGCIASELSDPSDASAPSALVVLMTVLLLCEIESIQRHHRGAIFPHIRALRHLATPLLANGSGYSGATSVVQGFVLETYAYFAIVANITPYGLDITRTVTVDSFLLSLEEKLAGYATFGIFFSSMHGLFSLIPQLSLLARRRLEIGHDVYSGDHTDLFEQFQRLQNDIETWIPPVQIHAHNRPAALMSPHWSPEHATVATIYRHALFIYLETSRCGSIVADTVVLRRIQNHADAVMRLSHLVLSSPLSAIMLWPTMVVLSCCVEKSQQAMARARLSACPYTTANVDQAVELLDRLWADPAPEAFGPYGLYYVMQKSGISFCMS